MTAPAFRRPPDGRLIPTPLPQPRWYTAQEVAAMARVSKMTVYRMAERGEIHAVRVGRSIRISAESVQWLLAGEW